MIEIKLNSYFEEMNIHIQKLNRAIEVLKPLYPIDFDVLEDLDETQKDKLDILVFRFLKLQDLLGAKIFRTFLEFLEYPTNDFLSILKELEKMGIVDIDTWATLRKLRNTIAHDYPEDDEEKLEAINFLIQNIESLIKTGQKIENLYKTKQ